MYRAFKMMTNNNIHDVEIYNHNGSMWGIITKNKQWVFEFTKEDNPCFQSSRAYLTKDEYKSSKDEYNSAVEEMRRFLEKEA